ncbi:heme-binding protein 2-like [Pollicipes pollicipes]|uniref:heme-binding protein 2-like n=1 Tax=Pollicipes pollicipes TaxID=41117 RepID=UPI0018855C7B|nr:heme-binding protein 2-like [Pollicipes pollicipes]
MRVAGAVLVLCLVNGCRAQETSPPGAGGEPAEESQVGSILDSLGTWFSGVSDKLYTAVTKNIGENIDLATVSDRVTELIPEFDYAPNTVINKNEEAGYEVRHYPSQRWACTAEPVTVEPVEEEAVQWNRTKLMFDRLFKYFSGENSRDEKIQMTLPLTNRFDAYSEYPTYNMCFYIPRALQSSPPTPDDPNVELTLWPAKTFVVRRFGGFVLYRRGWDRAAFLLEKISREQGLQGIDFTKYYSVNYDLLVKFWNRKNEVWFELAA